MALALPTPSLPFSAPSVPASGVSSSHGRTFVDFDDRLLALDARDGAGAGFRVLVVRAPQALHGAILAHASRRLQAGGFHPVDASSAASPAVTPFFVELASQLDMAVVPGDAHACAEAIEQAASLKRAAMLASFPRRNSWDYAVATALVHGARTGVALFVAGPEREVFPDADTFDVTSELSAEGRLRWLGAVAEEAATALSAETLQNLEVWWTRARHVASEAPSLESLTGQPHTVLSCLALAGRSLPYASLLSLAQDEELSAAVDALVRAGFVTRRGSLVSLGCGVDAGLIEKSACDAERLATARILAGGVGFEPEPWAYARAAELFLLAGGIEEADRAMHAAVRGVDDMHAVGEIHDRWFSAVASIKGEVGVFLRRAAAERALGLGEANEALRWCESAASIGPEDATTSMLMGRAFMQLGDLVAARVSLLKAQSSTDDEEIRAQVIAELAELSYLGGDLKAAAEQATDAIARATTLTTRLSGRNTLGKILLAEASWDAADVHFTEDLLAASQAGESLTELRARLNRGVALMSKGQLEEARAILTRVLDDGKRLGEDRACAFAYVNLGVIASRHHDYASALTYWEQAIRFRPTLRGRIASARTIANLAELRRRLGLIEHAEHALSFGRRLLGLGTTAAWTSHFSRVSARIALERGNTDLARREIHAAIASSEAAGDRDFLGEAYRVAARVALADGDVQRAADALASAERLVTNDHGRADLEIVRAHYLRALGQEAIETANYALSLARKAQEEDLLGEIHALLALLYRDAGDGESARYHCARAIAVRDELAASLPTEIRTAFLAKAEMLSLARLQSSLSQEPGFSRLEADAPRTLRPSSLRVEAGREIIGEDVQIRSLLVAIRKVAGSNSTILIRGESGTGKELVAEALHRASDRSSGPLVSVNCAALVETLLLSELFGHEKGAFTGASARRRGRFEMAEGGTLFLDEIGDISPRTQVALLRVLQEKTFERVGGAQPLRANVRVICATHRDLKAMVERGEFREDLYYRLRGITLEVPALRARLGDLPRIAEHLLSRISLERAAVPKSLSPDAIELLQRHRWPGNVRELENVLRAVSLFADGELITVSDLIENVDELRVLAQSSPASTPPLSCRGSLLPASPSSVASFPGVEVEEGDGALPEGESSATAVAYAQVRQGSVSLSDIKRQIERDCISRALSETKGNITRAASLLGMKRPRLSQLVKQYGLAVVGEGSQ